MVTFFQRWLIRNWTRCAGRWVIPLSRLGGASVVPIVLVGNLSLGSDTSWEGHLFR